MKFLLFLALIPVLTGAISWAITTSERLSFLERENERRFKEIRAMFNTLKP